MAQLNFDASQVEPSVPFEAVPPNKYLVEITNSSQKATKAGDGTYLELEFTILDGEYRGRKIWERLCLNHHLPRTVEIARSHLSAICHAVGVMKPRDSSELHRIPLVVTVKAKCNNEGMIYNEVRGYAKREGFITKPTPPSTAPTQASQYPQAPVDDNVPPWER
ncbi:MAG: DUF669 domain-containing protein [Planctomycetaceae bacterium]|nr:DUF669 domain-containing protein [Planctomycetaceae bacterium]